MSVPLGCCCDVACSLVHSVVVFCLDEGIFEVVRFEETCLRDREADDRMDCALVKARFTNGRNVAIEPAIMPVPNSIVDHTEILVAFPLLNVNKLLRGFGSLTYRRSLQSASTRLHTGSE